MESTNTPPTNTCYYRESTNKYYDIVFVLFSFRHATAGGFMQAWEPAPHHHSVTEGECRVSLGPGKDALISNDGANA